MRELYRSQFPVGYLPYKAPLKESHVIFPKEKREGNVKADYRLKRAYRSHDIKLAAAGSNLIASDLVKNVIVTFSDLENYITFFFCFFSSVRCITVK